MKEYWTEIIKKLTNEMNKAGGQQTTLIYETKRQENYQQRDNFRDIPKVSNL